MSKISLALCCVLAFLGVIVFSGVNDAQAVHVMIYWRDMAVCGLDDAQRMNRSVFSYKRAGGLNPPVIGGATAIIDIADRTGTQMRLLATSLGDPANGRFVLKFGPGTEWIYNQLYYKGFITIRWGQVRGIFWDKLSNGFPTGPWLWASATGRLWDDCKLNCDAQACQKFGQDLPDVAWCECEEWQGRWFCHKKNYFKYSDLPDQW